MIRTVTSSDPYDLSEKLNKLESLEGAYWKVISVVKHGAAFVAFLQRETLQNEGY